MLGVVSEITEDLPVILVHLQLLLFLGILDVLENDVVQVDCIRAILVQKESICGN